MDELTPHVIVLRERRDWLRARIEAKRSIGWDVEWDQREHDALAATLTELEDQGRLDAANRNTAPYPWALLAMVQNLTYKDGWTIELRDVDRGQGSRGLTLCICVTTPNSYRGDGERKTINVMHYMPVPPAAYNERSWRRWLLEQILLVERHEACEFFELDGEKVFAPLHADGNDPYTIVEVTCEDEVRVRGGQRSPRDAVVDAALAWHDAGSLASVNELHRAVDALHHTRDAVALSRATAEQKSV